MPWFESLFRIDQNRTINFRAALILLLSLCIRGSEAEIGKIDSQQRRLSIQEGIEVAQMVLAFCAQHESFAQQQLDIIKTLRAGLYPSPHNSVINGFARPQLPPLPQLASQTTHYTSPLLHGVESPIMGLRGGPSIAGTGSQPFTDTSPFHDPAMSTDSDSYHTSATGEGPSQPFGNLFSPSSSQHSPSSLNPAGSIYHPAPTFYPWQDPPYPESYNQSRPGSSQIN